MHAEKPSSGNARPPSRIPRCLIKKRTEREIFKYARKPNKNPVDKARGKEETKNSFYEL